MRAHTSRSSGCPSTRWSRSRLRRWTSVIEMVLDEGLEGTVAHAVAGVVCELGVPASGAEKIAAGSQRYGDGAAKGKGVKEAGAEGTGGELHGMWMQPCVGVDVPVRQGSEAAAEVEREMCTAQRRVKGIMHEQCEPCPVDISRDSTDFRWASISQGTQRTPSSVLPLW
ncbi:hypothetical protein B0H11DRAFT_1937383 [Mycena galericulata]|nr:hypothetical protein B0H11DRAFT_1937383 [Mycena galericulata]